MELKFTFEDGSEAIAHYGVLGMKWGVRNDETRAKYMGSRHKVTILDDIISKVTTGHYVDRSDASIVQNANTIAKHNDVFERRRSSSPDAEMKAINPFYEDALSDYYRNTIFSYDASSQEYSKALTNCATCSIIYDLRRRGYNLDANMTENMAYVNVDIPYYYANAEMQNSATLEDAERKLEEEPDGARGMLTGITVNGGGHAIAWEKENGKVVYRDCQSGEKYDAKTIHSLFSNDLTKRFKSTFTTCRLDDKQPNLTKMYQHGLVSKSGRDSGKDYAGDKARSVAGTYAIGLRRVDQGYAKLKDYGSTGIADYVSKAVRDTTTTYNNYEKR